MVDLVLIHQLKIAAVRSPEDCIRDVPPNDICYSLCAPLFESNDREAEAVLKICLVLRVTIRVDFWFNGAIFDVGSFGG